MTKTRQATKRVGKGNTARAALTGGSRKGGSKRIRDTEEVAGQADQKKSKGDKSLKNKNNGTNSRYRKKRENRVNKKPSARRLRKAQC